MNRAVHLLLPVQVVTEQDTVKVHYGNNESEPTGYTTQSPFVWV